MSTSRWYYSVALFVWVCGIMSPTPAWADAEAQADSAMGVAWNFWNNFDTSTKRWLYNPGGSTYALLAEAVAPGGPLVPPAGPFPAPPGSVTIPPAPGPWPTKFVQNAAGSATGGKATWGAAIDPAAAPSGSWSLGTATGSSAKWRTHWSATGVAAASGACSVATGRVAAYGKVYDPFDFHDFVPETPPEPGDPDYLTATAALTFSPELSLGGMGGREALYTGYVSSAAHVDINDVTIASFELTLSGTGADREFSSAINFADEARLYTFSHDPDGNIVPGGQLDKQAFINMVNGFYDPQSGTWSPPAGGFGVMVAYDLPFPLSYYLDGGHVPGKFGKQDVFYLAVVPEPASLLLLALGGLLGRPRRVV